MGTQKLWKSFFPALLWICLLTQTLSGSDYSVGEILSFGGTVFLDPFGTGDAEAINKEGKAIYRNSIIITEAGSSAVIRILDQEFSIPPSSHQEVSSIIALETKKKSSPWFTPLLDMVRKTTEFLFPQEENVDLVSRGYKITNLQDDLFGFDEEGDQITDFALELDSLLSHPNREESGLTPGEYDFKMGFCYFQLGSYQDAARLMASALRLCDEEEQLSGKSPHFRNALVLLSGITYYLKADFKKAAGFLEEFMEANKENDYTPFAAWLMADTLFILGQETRARDLLKQSHGYFNEHELSREFELYYKARQP